ncbi:hypothetical protein [Microbacterium sp. JZ31]|uniref:hypothetical protein n=1 Tax=Microbacterium sp. JZ31 TaxID=1906274 RepID=UPI001933A5C5|nr:hypothetical protein [Microbacterium sp. JZ31]
MNTTVTPPPPAPASSPAPATPPRSGGPGKPVAIILIVIGALLLLGTIAGAIRSTVAAATRVTDTLTAEVSGVSSLDVQADAAQFRIEFADVEEATLEITDSQSEWTIRRDGDELRVSSRDGLLDGWGRWDGPRWGWGWGRDEERVVLTLPESLEGVDARLAVSAGALDSDGSFGALELELGAGSLDVRGSAESLAADINAGAARIALAEVGEAQFTLAAGRLEAELTGAQPELVDIGVSAGSLDLTLPAGEYDVQEDISAGAIDNRLETASASEHQVAVDIAAGHVSLRSAG